MKIYMLKSALNNAMLFPSANAAPIQADALELIASNIFSQKR